MKKSFSLILALLCLTLCCKAQKLSKDEMQKYEAEVRSMLTYLEETLNFIGDTATTAQEKEIVFNESWSKVFIDDKVQIEDDLMSRKTPINKDVQAYLKDIDFFFKKAKFQFDIQSIANNTREDGTPFFKVSLSRHLTAVTINDENVDNIQNRFVEINLDRQNNNMKIASIYTTKINEKEELRNWWNSLSGNWKQRLGHGIKLYDSIPIETVGMISNTDFIASYPIVNAYGGTDMKDKTFKNDMTELDNRLKQVTQRQSVDISGIREIISLDPLSELSDIICLDVSGTSIEDISVLRAANKLKVLKANGTLINDISPLKYCITLEELEVANTNIDDLSVLSALRNLQKLNVSQTRITTIRDVGNCPNLTVLNASATKIPTIAPIADLNALMVLDVSQTAIRDLSPLIGRNNLQSLNVSNTAVSNLAALGELENLRDLYCSNTSIRDLTPLKSHRRLSKIYCDKTKIGVMEASEFAKGNPYTLVIYDTEALRSWWNDLPIYWKSIFAKQINLDAEPTTEQLHEIINMKELDLSGNTYIQNLLPVSRLTNLETLDISYTETASLMALQGLFNLENLILKHTFVNDLTPLQVVSSLKVLNIENTPIVDLTPLRNNGNLEIIWADSTGIRKTQVTALKEAQRQVTIVYQTSYLQEWWDGLEEVWHAIFRVSVPFQTSRPQALEIQRIIDLRQLSIEPQDEPLQNLQPLEQFIWLESLTVNNEAIRDLSPLSNKEYLTELNIQNNPVGSLTPIAMDNSLESINIENTQISDLSPLERMYNLKSLNASGTAIRSVKPLSNLSQLECLFINNTNVKSVASIEEIASLKQLKVYNTKVKKKSIEKLQQKRLDMNIIYY